MASTPIERFRRCCWYISDRVDRWEKLWLDLGEPSIELLRAREHELERSLEAIRAQQRGTPWYPARPPTLEVNLFGRKLAETKLGKSLLGLCTQAEIQRRQIEVLNLVLQQPFEGEITLLEAKRAVDPALIRPLFPIAVQLYPGLAAYRSIQWAKFATRFDVVFAEEDLETRRGRRLVRSLVIDEIRGGSNIDPPPEILERLNDRPFTAKELRLIDRGQEPDLGVTDPPNEPMVR